MLWIAEDPLKNRSLIRPWTLSTVSLDMEESDSVDMAASLAFLRLKLDRNRGFIIETASPKWFCGEKNNKQIRSTTIIDSILFCKLFTIKDHSKKSGFLKNTQIRIVQ